MKLVLPVFVVALLLSGCAAQQRQSLIHQRVAEYTYAVPAEQVTPQVVAFLEEQGYVFRRDERGPSRWSSTAWRRELGPSAIAASSSSYLVTVARVDDTHCKVRLMKQTWTSAGGAGGYESAAARDAARAHPNVPYNHAQPADQAARRAITAQRDLQAEWMLLQRVAPDEAQRLAAPAPRS